MKAIILAAGYATRLYPLTKDKPKALLPIAGKPIISHIIEKIHKIPDIDEIIITSNAIFYKQFNSWLKENQNQFTKKITIINDNTYTNETRLGGIGDLWFAIEQKNIQEDILVIAGDNLFDFSLKDFVDFFKTNKKTANVSHEIYNKENAKRFGVLELDENNKVIEFEEKPENPKTSLISHAIYIFSKQDLLKIQEYLIKNQNTDGPGYLIKELCSKQDVIAFIAKGDYFDIGIIEDYEKANEIWKQKKNEIQTN